MPKRCVALAPRSDVEDMPISEAPAENGRRHPSCEALTVILRILT